MEQAQHDFLNHFRICFKRKIYLLTSSSLNYYQIGLNNSLDLILFPQIKLKLINKTQIYLNSLN